MNTELTIRRFRPGDVPALFSLFRQTVHRVNIRDYSDEQVRAWAPDEMNAERWATLANTFAVVAELEGQPVGFADMEADGHLDRFFVHADHQRMGVGKVMMTELMTEAGRLGLDKVYAEVSVTARPFFERNDFEVLAEQEVVVRGVSLVNYRMERRMRKSRPIDGPRERTSSAWSSSRS